MSIVRRFCRKACKKSWLRINEFSQTIPGTSTTKIQARFEQNKRLSKNGYERFSSNSIFKVCERLRDANPKEM